MVLDNEERGTLPGMYTAQLMQSFLVGSTEENLSVKM